jgi:hypothetical protein
MKATYYKIVDRDMKPFNVLAAVSSEKGTALLVYNRTTEVWYPSPNGPAYLMGTSTYDIYPVDESEAAVIAGGMGTSLDDIAKVFD